MEDTDDGTAKAVFSRFGRATVLATVAAVTLMVEPTLAFAGAAAGKTVCHDGEGGGMTDVSARRRHYRGGGGAAAAAAFAGIVGTGLAIAATQNRRADYDDYLWRPVYYGGGPITAVRLLRAGLRYYGGGSYFGGGYPTTISIARLAIVRRHRLVIMIRPDPNPPASAGGFFATAQTLTRWPPILTSLSE